jgi:excisionase family DNA binding protein
MRHVEGLLAVDWIKRIPFDQIPGVIVLLSARLLEENHSRSLSGQDTTVIESDKLLAAGELAKQLNVPESWVRSEQRAGRIPFKRLGKYVRFNRREVEAALSDETRRRPVLPKESDWMCPRTSR